MMLATGDDVIQVTGGQIDGMVMTLIDSANEKDENARCAILKSLEGIGKKQPNLVLSSCHSYLGRHRKLSSNHLICILRIMEEVCQQNISELAKTLVIEVIKQSLSEIMNPKETSQECRNAASNIIVALGKSYHNEVMEALLVPFQPAVLPHITIVYTLANLATTNPYGIVPFLKAVLSSMVPMLGGVKTDSMKLAFAHGISKFSESILDYIANIDKAPDKSVCKEVFSNEISTFFDIFFNNWLNTRDLKLKWAIVEALGRMAHLISKEKIEEQLPRLISGILSLYKKHQDCFNITEGLFMVLESAAETSPAYLELQLDTILAVIFPQICVIPDYSQPETVKNHKEVLRCFVVLVRKFPDHIVNYLFAKIDLGQEKTRIGGLVVFKHIINSSAEYLVDKMLIILNGLKPVLNDQNNKIKKAMTHVIVAMAHHEYFECPGSQLMLDFILHQCALPPSENSNRRPTDVEHISNEQLRALAENILHLFVTTVDQLESILWPTLLEYLTLTEYVSAINIICKCAGNLAIKKRDNNAEDFIFNFNKHTNVPRTHEIIARLIVLAGNPNFEESRAMNVLNLMKGISPVLEKELMSLWDTMVPEALNLLKDVNEEKIPFSQKQWEDLMLKLFTKSIEEINREEWTLKVGNAILKQLHLYDAYPRDKNMAFKVLGIVMRKTKNKPFINACISTIFSSLKYTNEAEREGCAIAMGFAASVHTDLVLVKLEEETKADHKKMSGIFNFLKDMKGEGDVEKHHAAFILCYGFIALYAPSNMLVSRIDTPILRMISKFFNNSKDISVKISLIHAIDLVAQAVHPSSIVSHSYVLKTRGDLLNQVMSLIKHESPTSLNSTLKALAINACSNLIKLSPTLSGPNLTSVIQTIATYVASIPENPSFDDNETNRSKYTLDEYEVILNETLKAFNNLLVEILLQDFSSETVDFVFQNLSLWMKSSNNVERSRMMGALLNLIRSYQENMNSGDKVMLAFTKLGTVLGALIPRCVDPEKNVRAHAIECLEVLLKISSHRLAPSSSVNRAIPKIEDLKEVLLDNNIESTYAAVEELTKIIVEVVPSDQMRSFVFTLIDGIEDPFEVSSSSTSIILKGMLDKRGNELKAEAVEVLDSIYGRLSRINFTNTRLGATRCINALAIHNVTTVVPALVNHSLPYDEFDNYIWQVIGNDVQFHETLLNFLLDILSQTTPYTKLPDPRQRKRDAEDIKIANQVYAGVICTMIEIFRQASFETTVANNFARIYASLTLALCSLVDAYPPLPPERSADPNLQLSFLSMRHVQNQPIRWAIDAFKSFMLCSRDYGYNILKEMTLHDGWSGFNNVSTFQEGIIHLTTFLVKHTPDQISKIISLLNANSNTIYENQRVGIVAMSAELINQRCNNDHALLEMLMNCLISKLVDPSRTIRQLCLRGLSAVAEFGCDEVHKYSTTVLSAMMAGIDDRDDPNDLITLEAMTGLSRVLANVDEEHIKGIQINIALKIRPMIEKSDWKVRFSAIKLLGNLAKVAADQAKIPFAEQIHSNFISLLLHLNDNCEEVSKACKSTLKIVGPMMDAPKINDMFQKHLLEGCVLRYGDFINDLSKAIISDRPDKINFYVTGCVQFFKSSEVYMQANAVLLAGFLLGNLNEELQSEISKEHICGALIMLLKDSSSEVKTKAAEAMGLLHSY